MGPHDGTTLVLEVDGRYHLDIVQHGDDDDGPGDWRPAPVSVRCSAYELRA